MRSGQATRKPLFCRTIQREEGRKFCRFALYTPGMGRPVSSDASVRLAPVAPPDEVLVRFGGEAACALWWNHGLTWKDRPAGAIGQIEAANENVLVALLEDACLRLHAAGCAYALGPLDASMWGRHRLVTAPGTRDPFDLDVDTPSWWPFAFRAAGFSPVAYYASIEHALAGTLPGAELPDGLRLRSFTPTSADLRRLHPLLEHAFAGRPGFVPLTSSLFAATVGPYRDLVADDFALVIEDADGAMVGFGLGLPDPDGETLVIRAIAAAAAWPRLDCWLLCTLAAHAHAHGFRRVVHALVPESDARRLCETTPGHVRRRYALLAAPLR